MTSTPLPQSALPPLDRDLGLNRLGMERVGSRSAFVLLGAIALLLLIAFGLGALADQPMTAHRTKAVGGSTVVFGSGVDRFRLAIPAGWTQDVTSSSASSLVLVRSGIRTTVETQGGVVDATNFYSRRLRLLSFQGLPGRAVDTEVSRSTSPQVVIGDIDGQGRDAVEAVVVRRDGVALTLTTATVDGGLTAARSATLGLVEGVS